MTDPIVIVGGSTAGLSASRELRASGFDGVIQVVEREDGGPYRRPAVSKGIVGGTQTPADVAIPWPEGLDLQRLAGLTATSVDLDRRRLQVVDRDGGRAELAFSALVAATGSTARPLGLPGPSAGVASLRDMADGVAARDRLAAAQEVVVVGAGFIGLEVAAVARRMGKAVTVVEVAPLPLAHAVGELFGSHIADIHRSHGVRLVCGVGVRELLGREVVEGVRLQSGVVIEADLVIAAVGAAPVTGWLASSGLDGTSGLVCDRNCVAVGAERVVAAGDIASWYNPLYGRQMRVEHWTNAIEQGTFAGRSLLGRADPAGFVSAPYFWSDQYDVKIQSVGSPASHDEIRVLDRDGARLLVAYGSKGILVAVAGVNAGAVLPRYRPLIESGTRLADVPTAVKAQMATGG